jgi:beta-lactamase regulating signal transducer with metallopeptidase domain
MQAFALEAFRELSARWIWPALLHSVWIGLLAAAISALIIQGATRRSHRGRHAILLGALLLVVAGTVLATALQRALAVHSPEAQTWAWEFIAETGPGEVAMTSDGAEHSTLSVARVSPTGSRSLFDLWGRLASLVTIANRVRPFLVALWLLTVVGIAGFLAIGARTVCRLCSEAEPAAAETQQKALAIARRLRLARVPRVLVHAGVEEPFLGGIFRPAILLPGRWIASVPGDCLDAILAHELAHARRLDHAVNLAQRVVETLLFFHPAVHWLSRSLRRQREFCADALAVRLTGDALALAAALESAALFRNSSRRTPASASSLGGGSTSLLPRIQELLGMTPSRARLRRWPFVALPAAGIFALFAVSAGMAQDKPPAQPAAASEKPSPAALPHGNSVRGVPLHVAYQSKPDDVTRMIVYEVRFLTGDASEWRRFLGKRTKLEKQAGDCTAWLIDEKTLRAWLAHAKEDAAINVLQAPRVATFDGGLASIFDGQPTRPGFSGGVRRGIATRPAELEPEPDGMPRIQSLQPIVEKLPVGSVVSMVGKIMPGKIRLTVDVRDSTLLPLAESRLNAQRRKPERRASDEQPMIFERRSRVGCDVPAGSYLAICMGLHEEPVIPFTATGPMTGVEPGGATHFEARTDANRLVVFIVGARGATDASATPRIDSGRTKSDSATP